MKNIRKYNAQAEDGRQMPYIVTVIDEYSDFLSFHRCDRKSREISCDIFHIICLAQKGRAVGMHLVITTQRPSPEVISRIIKVNFTTRMAFRVASKQDSLTIIDTPGEERLIGNGDMIFSSGGETTRIQGAFVDNNDIDAVIRSISSRQSGGERHDVQYCLPAVEDAKPECTGCGGLTDLHCLDDRFEDAAKLVVSTQIGAASHLQRNLEISYVKAARLMGQLEAAGIVGPPVGINPRKVLVELMEELERKLKAYTPPRAAY